jgi:hypothetical protein
MMRTYPTDSPEAITRLVALTAMADGNLSLEEILALETDNAAGLSQDETRTVLRGLCDDLLKDTGMDWNAHCQVPLEVLRPLLDELNSPDQRLLALQEGLRVAQADRDLHDAESRILLDAMQHWGMLDEPPRHHTR